MAGLPSSMEHVQPVLSKKGVTAVVVGNAMEFYDFICYASFAKYIAGAYFPSSSEYVSLMLAVVGFAIGFITRPLGGFVIGAFGDRVGRKPAMMLTVGMIAIGTLGIAATPTYASIGVAAPIIVLACPLLQGPGAGRRGRAVDGLPDRERAATFTRPLLGLAAGGPGSGALPGRNCRGHAWP